MAWNPPMYVVRPVGVAPAPVAPGSNTGLYLLLLAGAGAAVYFLTSSKGKRFWEDNIAPQRGPKPDKTVKHPNIYVEKEDDKGRVVEHPKSWQIRELQLTYASGFKKGDSKEIYRAASVEAAKASIRDWEKDRAYVGADDDWSYFIAPSTKQPGDPGDP